jgi:hypothetical protein
MFARIKPHSPRHGRTSRRYTFGGKVFVEGYSSQGKSLWYSVSDQLGQLLALQRNEVGKRIFDVVTEEQARAIDIQEGNPFANQSASRVKDTELYKRVYAPVESRVNQPEAPLWRYDPDAESVPDLPAGYLENSVSTPPLSPPVVRSKPSVAPRTPVQTEDDKAWAKVEEEQRVRTPQTDKRAAQELADATPEDGENDQDPGSQTSGEDQSSPPPAGNPTATTSAEPARQPRRRGDQL